MKFHCRYFAIVSWCLLCLTGCKPSAIFGGRAIEHSKDPVLVEVWAFRQDMRQLFDARRFDDLERQAAKVRVGKELFGNGSWKIFCFYEAFEPTDEEPESQWQSQDRIHQEWVQAKPSSVTARIAHANFQTAYAWHARGSDYADKVSNEGWKLFATRLATARKILGEARLLPERDPVWWSTAQTVALGEQWSTDRSDALVFDAVQYEPKFFVYDTKRARALLPRWHGKPGDWEMYADKASTRPEGLGNEAYARIVIELRGAYGNIFKESKASWPKTREGLTQMVKQYPDSLEIISLGAFLGCLAEDRTFAKEMFDRLDGTYFNPIWNDEKYYTHCLSWSGAAR